MVMEEAFSVNIGRRLVVIPGVDDIGATLQNFQWTDYTICILWLVICLVIGVYFGFFYVATTAQEYLVGQRRLKLVPVAMSLVASSSTVILTIPTEIYLYGIQRIYLVIGLTAMTVIMSFTFIPVFSHLNLTSVYEIAWLPVLIFIPISTFNEVTRLDAQFIVPILCMISIFYTSLGGMKAVVWTDMIQSTMILAALILVAVKGTLDIGGLNTVIDRNLETNRIEGPNLDLNPLTVYTFWSTTIGGCFYYLHVSGVNQNIFQKYFSLQSANHAKRAAWLFTFALCVIFMLCVLCGLLIYAMFYECDPLTTKLARENDKILALFVARTLESFPGLLGLFVAGTWSASLSLWSTSLLALTTVIFEDFYSLICARQLTDKQYSLLMKLTVIIIGIICVGLTCIIDDVSTAVEICKLIGYISSGASLGMFTSGVTLPWINGKGVLVGGISSLVVMGWLNIQKLANNANFNFAEKVLTTEGCHYHFIPKQNHNNGSSFVHSSEVFSFYEISYVWYTLLGSLITIIVGLIVSMVLEPSDPRDVDLKLLAPFLKKIIKPREFPNEPGDCIIYAYDTRKKVDRPLQNITGPE